MREASTPQARRSDCACRTPASMAAVLIDPPRLGARRDGPRRGAGRTLGSTRTLTWIVKSLDLSPRHLDWLDLGGGALGLMASVLANRTIIGAFAARPPVLGALDPTALRPSRLPKHVRCQLRHSPGERASSQDTRPSAVRDAPSARLRQRRRDRRPSLPPFRWRDQRERVERTSKTDSSVECAKPAWATARTRCEDAPRRPKGTGICWDPVRYSRHVRNHAARRWGAGGDPRGSVVGDGREDSGARA